MKEVKNARKNVYLKHKNNDFFSCGMTKFLAICHLQKLKKHGLKKFQNEFYDYTEYNSKFSKSQGLNQISS